jgi:Xaa-Pro aminopeptidase
MRTPTPNASARSALLSPDAVARAQAALDAFAQAEGIDLLCVSAQDAFLSEYTPLANNHRAMLSGFSGSTGDGLHVARPARTKLARVQPFQLFVDGRYHLQADGECSTELVLVEKLPLAKPIEDALLETVSVALAALGGGVVAVDARRTTLARARALQAACDRTGASLRLLRDDEISRALGLPGWRTERAVEPVATALTGRDPALTASLLLRSARRAAGGAATPCVASCASDDAAFLLNARGYHLPHLSSVLAYSFVLPGRIVVFLPSESATCSVNLPTRLRSASITAEPPPEFALEVVRGSLESLSATLATSEVTALLFNESHMNALLPEFLASVWPKAAVVADFRGIEILRARKTPEELASFRDSYLRSSRAIARTLRWAKETVTQVQRMNASDETLPSEADLATRVADEYGREGALELSFNTIAGTGPNGAVIHYGTPSPRNRMMPGEITLLDSGAYYAPGFATDCTRVFYNGDAEILAPQAWQKEIYTVTLKAFLRGMRAEFLLTDAGRAIDAEVRGVCKAHGYDYAHGTGHGVGIHVHESGIRLSTASTYAMTENACVSMEPGIYLPGKGGVRIENVVRVEPRDPAQGVYGFENLMWVGFDWDLVDVALLDDAEKAWLASYERRCAALGTTITRCPLV